MRVRVRVRIKVRVRVESGFGLRYHTNDPVLHGFPDLVLIKSEKRTGN